MSEDTPERFSRSRAILVLLAGLGLLLALDLATGQAPDPFAAPPPIALGSGQAATGTHCAMPPPR